MREKILELVKEEYQRNHADKQSKFVAGETLIPFAGRVYDENEMVNLVDASLDFWLTAGRYADDFEAEFSEYMEQEHCLLVNSGSSANLVAISSLTSPKLGDKRLKPGDEVITVAAGFPTTVNPIIQNNLIPVFVDVELETYNIKVSDLELALSDKTKAVMIAHTLGNPFDIDAVVAFCKKYGLYLIEDCCDAVGSKYKGKQVGSFGDLSTVSFYPAHHITMGEGGAVLTNSHTYSALATSFRDWGRDCYCAPGCDNSCGKRFAQQWGKLPKGYDHKYVYTHIGYNLKVTDMQAAVGCAQLNKLDSFVAKRQDNFRKISKFLERHQEYLLLPKATENSEPSWFGFPITVKVNEKFNKRDITKFIENNKIMTREIFAGNMTLQPAFENANYRVIGDLKNTNIVMNDTFFIGVYPGITDEKLDYIESIFDKFFEGING